MVKKVQYNIPVYVHIHITCTHVYVLPQGSPGARLMGILSHPFAKYLFFFFKVRFIISYHKICIQIFPSRDKLADCSAKNDNLAHILEKISLSYSNLKIISFHVLCIKWDFHPCINWVRDIPEFVDGEDSKQYT